MNNFVQKTNEAVRDSDIALVAIDGFSENDFAKRLDNIIESDVNSIYFVDIQTGNIYEKNKENVTTLPMSSERIQGANIRILEESSVLKEYIRELLDVNQEAMVSDTYLSANETYVRYQSAHDSAHRKIEREFRGA